MKAGRELLYREFPRKSGKTVSLEDLEEGTVYVVRSESRARELRKQYPKLTITTANTPDKLRGSHYTFDYNIRREIEVEIWMEEIIRRLQGAIWKIK